MKKVACENLFYDVSLPAEYVSYYFKKKVNNPLLITEIATNVL